MDWLKFIDEDKDERIVVNKKSGIKYRVVAFSREPFEILLKMIAEKITDPNNDDFELVD